MTECETLYYSLGRLHGREGLWTVFSYKEDGGKDIVKTGTSYHEMYSLWRELEDKMQESRDKRNEDLKKNSTYEKTSVVVKTYDTV